MIFCVDFGANAASVYAMTAPAGGEDYLFAADRFVAIELPTAASASPLQGAADIKQTFEGMP